MHTFGLCFTYGLYLLMADNLVHAWIGIGISRRELLKNMVMDLFDILARHVRGEALILHVVMIYDGCIVAQEINS